MRSEVTGPSSGISIVDDRADFVDLVPAAARVPRVERVDVLPGIVVVALVRRRYHPQVGSCMFVYHRLAGEREGKAVRNAKIVALVRRELGHNFWALRDSHHQPQRRHGRPTIARSALQHNKARCICPLHRSPGSLPLRNARIPDHSMRNNEIAARKEEEDAQHLPPI